MNERAQKGILPHTRNVSLLMSVRIAILLGTVRESRVLSRVAGRLARVELRDELERAMFRARENILWIGEVCV